MARNILKLMTGVNLCFELAYITVLLGIELKSRD